MGSGAKVSKSIGFVLKAARRQIAWISIRVSSLLIVTGVAFGLLHPGLLLVVAALQLDELFRWVLDTVRLHRLLGPKSDQPSGRSGPSDL